MFQCYVDCGQNDSFLFLFSLSTYVLQWESAPPTHASKSTKVIRNANTPDKIKYRGKSEILEYAMHYKIVGTTATQLLLSHHRHSPAAPQRPHRTRRQHMEGNQRRVMRIASHLCGGNHGGAVAPRTNTLFFFFSHRSCIYTIAKVRCHLQRDAIQLLAPIPAFVCHKSSVCLSLLAVLDDSSGAGLPSEGYSQLWMCDNITSICHFLAAIVASSLIQFRTKLQVRPVCWALREAKVM